MTSEKRHVRKKYTCPRCLYETSNKTNIMFHFYKLKKPCPDYENVSELTEEIKQHVLANRIYKVPIKPKPDQVIKQKIIYNNTMNNFVNSIDIFNKLDKLLKHQGKNLITFNSHVEKSLDPFVKQLKKGEDIQLSRDDILEIIDTVCKVTCNGSSKALETFNILYDAEVKKLKMYDDGGWKDLVIKRGITTMIKTIKRVYLDDYERYLLRRIHKLCECRERQYLNNLLNEYYKFLGVFNVDPVVMDNRDRNILYDMSSDEFFNASGTCDLCDKYSEKYRLIRDTIAQKEINQMQKQIIDILKQNSKHNIESLNKRVISLFDMDESFKKIIIEQSKKDDDDDSEGCDDFNQSNESDSEYD